jgi:hypothetical protein
MRDDRATGELAPNARTLDELADLIPRAWTDLEKLDSQFAEVNAATLEAHAVHCEAFKRFEALVKERGCVGYDRDALRLQLAELLAEARAQCTKKGDWGKWREANMPNRSERSIQELIALANADDPDEAREEEKARNREKVQRSRDKARNAGTVTRVSPDPRTAEPNPDPDVWKDKLPKVSPATSDPREGMLDLGALIGAVRSLPDEDYGAFAEWFLADHRARTAEPTKDPVETVYNDAVELRAGLMTSFVGRPVSLVDFDDELELAKVAAKLWPSQRMGSQLDSVASERS